MAVKTFRLTIARVGENLFDGEAQSATLPGAEGMFTVLPNHEAFVSPLKKGTIRYTDAAGEERQVDVERDHAAIAEISMNQATVLL